MSRRHTEAEQQPEFSFLTSRHVDNYDRSEDGPTHVLVERSINLRYDNQNKNWRKEREGKRSYV